MLQPFFNEKSQKENQCHIFIKTKAYVVSLLILVFAISHLDFIWYNKIDISYSAEVQKKIVDIRALGKFAV